MLSSRGVVCPPACTIRAVVSRGPGILAVARPVSDGRDGFRQRPECGIDVTLGEWEEGKR
jgi:hypothetical protein